MGAQKEQDYETNSTKTRVQGKGNQACAVADGGQQRVHHETRAAMRRAVCALLYNEEWVSVL